MEKLLALLKKKACADPKTIVFPESSDPRILEAARQIKVKGYAKIILLGTKPGLHAGIQVINPKRSPLLKEFAQCYASLQRDSGMTLRMALRTMQDPLFFGTMLVRQGYADGIISGATHAKSITLRPVLQLLRVPGRRVSSFFLMKRKSDYYFFADASVNIDPDETALADIAVTTADSAMRLFHVKPRVALLSFSTHGSNQHPLAQKVKKAAMLACKKRPRYSIDGELQADAALFPEVCRFKCGSCRLKGKANVLIFPDLGSANIAYKLVEWLGGYEAIGPILQGLAKPANDLSRGCTIKDIIDLTIITAVQAQLTAKEKAKEERE